MSEPLSREARVGEAFVTLADTLVSGFDVADLFVDLAGACTDLLEVTAAGLMLVDINGHLRVMASSSERSRLLELMEVQNDEGPCLDCHRTGAEIIAPDLTRERARWPRFATEALRVGFAAVYALPMRLRTDSIGALNLFHREPNSVAKSTLRLGQALADVATIAILQQRTVRSSVELSHQLQAALNTRVVIEQAKGVLAGRLDIDLPLAFEWLRAYARRSQHQLSAVAHAVVAGELNPEQLRGGGTR
jgi:transcriptional regulator with GAF, ATPase, and Fis domain